MNILKKREQLSGKIKVALNKAIQNLVTETKAKKSYLVIAGNNGKIKKIPAKDL